jgi:hypothetical protein
MARVTLPALPRRPGDLVFGGHLVLALSMAFWRAFESIPGLSAEDGGRFTTSSAGRLLAFLTLVLCGLAGLAVCLQSARRWRDPRIALLALALGLALSSRQRANLFDLVYAGLAVAFAVWWFRSERADAQASA